MQTFTHFSRHAFERIEQRTKLSCEEIARILDRKLALNTGRKPGFNRNHLLFYSAPDDDFYVAIQDGLTGTIVTVLPLDYHANLAWNIPLEDCIKAKELYLTAPVEDMQTQPASNATLFVISGHFLDGGGKQKTKVLQKLSSLPYENDIKKLLSDQAYFAKLNLLAAEKGIVIDRAKFDREMAEHQEKSRAGAEQKFKGGLGGTSDKIIRSHTAHHLLLAALRKVLGAHVHQRGSNITEERIRIDFSHDTKMTDEQKSEVENLVNEWITQDLPMQRIEMKKDEAEQIGAEMEFGVKYPDVVSVYYIGKSLDTAISKEFCGGPHIERIGKIGTFKIQKEEASSAGVRRIKAVIE